MGRLVVTLMKHQAGIEHIECSLPDGRKIIFSILPSKTNQVRVSIEADKEVIIKRKKG